MKNLSLEFSKLIKEHRIKSGLTQQELSQKLGYSTPQFISIIERGLSKVPLVTLGQLIVYIGLPEKKVTKLLMDEYTDYLKTEMAQGKSFKKINR